MFIYLGEMIVWNRCSDVSRWTAFIPPKRNYLGIGLKMLQPPRPNFKFFIYFLDQNSWQEIVFNEFRYASYSRIEVPITKGELRAIDVSVKTTEIINLKGFENREQCILEFLTKSNCSQVCAPLMFNYVPNLPMCTIFEHFWCQSVYILYVKEDLISTCFNAKKTTKYQIETATETFLDKGITGFWFRFTYISPRVEVQEERYIIGGTDFIGSVGGSLGLFLGFSFFSYASDLLEYIYKKFE